MATNNLNGPSGDAAWFDAWRGVLFSSAHVLRTVEPLLEQHSGLSLAFIDAMGRLYDAPAQRLRMQELQERSLFTRSGMTRLIDRIERAGYVQRESVPGDRRGVYVVLTPEGADVYAAAIERHREDLRQVFAERLTSEQHLAVAEALATFWLDGDS